MTISCDENNLLPSRWYAGVESLTRFRANCTRVKNTLDDEMLAGSV